MQITVGYRAFGDNFDIDFEIPDCFADNWDAQPLRDQYIADCIFKDTNLYMGPFWNRIFPFLPEDRNHTALSVGDRVMVDNRPWQCESFGWSLLESWYTDSRGYPEWIY